jgi:hypothetical protein
VRNDLGNLTRFDSIVERQIKVVGHLDGLTARSRP